MMSSVIHGGIVDVAGGVRPHARGRPEDMRKSPRTHMPLSPPRVRTPTETPRLTASAIPPQPPDTADRSTAWMGPAAPELP